MTFNIQDQVKLETILDSANNTGTVNQVLVSTGSNTLIWSNQGDISIDGSNTEILFNDSGLIGANNQFIFDKETGRVGIGTNSPTQTLDVGGTINTSANVHITGSIRDTSGSYGTSGQVLSSTTTGLSWIDAGSVSGALTAINGVDNRIAVFTGADEIEGDANFTWDGTNLNADGGAVFNESGADVDFRVESSSNTHALFVQGSDGFVGIGNSAPTSELVVQGSRVNVDTVFGPTTASSGNVYLKFRGKNSGTVSEATIHADYLSGLTYNAAWKQFFQLNGTELIRLESQNIIFNENGLDHDFRVESNLNDHALFLNGFNGNVGIGTAAPNGTLGLVTSDGGTNVSTNLNMSLPGTATQGQSVITLGSRQASVDYDNIISGSYALGLIFSTPNSHRFNDGTNYTFETSTAATIVNEDGIDHDFRVESSLNTHALFVQGSDGFIGVNQSAPGFRFDLVDDAAAYTDGEKSVASFSSASDQRSFLKIKNTHTNPVAGAPKAGLDLEVKDYANSPNVMRAWLELGQRTSAGAGGITNLTVPTTFRIYVDNDGDLTSSSGEFPSSQTVPGTQILYLSNTEVIFNEPGNDVDFRVESNVSAHALYMRGSDGRIGINASGPQGTLHVRTSNSSDNVRSNIFVDLPSTATQGYSDITFQGRASNIDYNSTIAGSYNNGMLFSAPSGQRHGFRFGSNVEYFTIKEAETVVNDSSSDHDFRVESDTLTHALFVQGSDGRVGINTSAPGSPLEVGVASGTSGPTSALRIISTDGGAWGVYPTSAVANPVWNTNVNSGEQFSWSVGGGEVVRIDAFGKVGIACTSPTQALDVVGTITTSADVHITGAIRDSSGDYGTSGQVLSSTATGINWIDQSSLSVGDADTLDGVDSTSFLRSDQSDTGSGIYTFSDTSTSATLNVSGHAGAASYNYFLSASNDGGVKAVHFVNGSTRTADGGVNTYTIRNDGGSLRLGKSNQSTLIEGSGDLTYNSNEVWHAGNDGTGSGLDADTLDGQQGTYYLNTSTSFGGDVSGTYNNIQVTDDSHNHIISNVDGLQSALDLKAPLASPALTGTATAVNLTISGNLVVNGETSTINSDNLNVANNVIELNSGLTVANPNDSGIIIERGTSGDNAFMGWDESENQFILGTTTATGDSTGNFTITPTTLSVGFTKISSSSNIPLWVDSTDAVSRIALSDTAGSLTLETSSGNLEVNIGGDASTSGTNSTRAMNISSGGDISFYEDTGVTAKFFWDSSAERLGIGTSTPNYTLDVNGDIKLSSTGTLWFDDTAGGVEKITSTGGGTLDLYSDVQMRFIESDVSAVAATINVNDSRMGIACTSPTVALDVVGDINATGALTATTKSFVINHPTKPNMKLRYGSLEGPENGVYIRGRLRGNIIELPDYWVGLVDEDTITVNLTPIINKQDLFVKEIKDNKVFVEGSDQINCFFTVYGERKDEPRFEVEYNNE